MEPKLFGLTVVTEARQIKHVQTLAVDIDEAMATARKELGPCELNAFGAYRLDSFLAGGAGFGDAQFLPSAHDHLRQ